MLSIVKVDSLISLIIASLIAVIKVSLSLELDKLCCAVKLYPLAKAIGFLMIDDNLLVISLRVS
ncbi:hypothetical protein IKS57_04520 [bacterium]|nr:hypothetical protein [bacterium]